MAIRSRIQGMVRPEGDITQFEYSATLPPGPPTQIRERAEPTKSCGPNDKTGACERTGSNSNLVPIILGAG